MRASVPPLPYGVAPASHRMSRRAVAALLAVLTVLATLLGAVPAGADIVGVAGDGLVPAQRYAGENRFDTAALIATEGGASTPVFAGSAVVVARGDVAADGLTGSYLAGALDAPLLLTGSTTLPAATVAALAERDPDRIYVLGGPAAVGAAVVDQLKDVADVTQLSGADRFATAVRVAGEGADLGGIGEQDGEATALLVAAGAGPDALVAGPLAAAESYPLLFTRTGELPAATLAAIADLGIERIVIVGGGSVVDEEVAASLRDDLGLTVERLGGATRDVTALLVAEYTRDVLGWDFAELAFAGADDRSLVDALALGPRAGLVEAPILFAGATGPAVDVRAALPTLGDPDAILVAGGERAVTPLALGAIRTGLALRAGGLAAPRGMTIGPDDALYVAETGFGGDDCVPPGDETGTCLGQTGAVTRVDDTGQERVVEGLPSAGPGAGPSDVAYSGATPFVTIGGGPAEDRDPVAEQVPYAAQLSTLLQVGDDGPEIVADLAAFEAANNSDGAEDTSGGDGDHGESPLNSNPFGVVRDDDRGVWIVTDAGANALLEITDAGEVSVKAVFPPITGPDGTRQAVPTSVVIGPGGDYYVSELGGEIPGASRVWRVDADTGSMEIYADGFTFALDLGFGPDDSLYVLQAVPTEPLEGEDPGPGTIVRVALGGDRTELGGGALAFPLGLQVTDTDLYVSHCPFCPTGGEVLELTLPE